MAQNEEQTFNGGQSADSVVRIDDTVHRSMGPNAPYVHQVLQLLAEKGYRHSPEFLGIDEKGREILTFMDGDIARDVEWTDTQLIRIAHMLKEFHDATVGSDLCNGKETVCHRDLAPWNTILKDGQPIAFIDFDGVEPGGRVEDLGYVLWTFLELGNTQIDTGNQIRRIKLMCDEYGYQDGKSLVDGIIREQQRVLQIREQMAQTAQKEGVRQFSAERIEVIQKEIQWVENNQELIENAL